MGGDGGRDLDGRLGDRNPPGAPYKDELGDPTNLLSGGFDVAFAIVFLYPLVILALSYNLLSGEKESGTLALTLSQPVSLGRLAAAKILARAGVVFGLTAAFTLAGALAAGVDFRAPGAATDLAAFFGVTAIYGLFWFALALLVNSRSLGSATNAMILSGVWPTLVVLGPQALPRRRLKVRSASRASSSEEATTALGNPHNSRILHH